MLQRVERAGMQRIVIPDDGRLVDDETVKAVEEAPLQPLELFWLDGRAVVVKQWYENVILFHPKRLQRGSRDRPPDLLR